MDRSRHRSGEEITEGTVYRRIPNWRGYFDPRTGRPLRKTFEPRPQDEGALSTDLARSEAERKLEKHPGFGLCALDIEQMRTQTGGKARVVRTLPERSHVRILGCDGEDVQEQLADLAQVLTPPKGENVAGRAR